MTNNALPRIILHNAISLDGRIDGFAPDIGKFYELAGIWHEDATLAGSETILAAPDEVPAEEASDFAMPATHEGRAWLVIPDSRGRVRIWHQLRRQPYWRVGIALTAQSTPPEYLDYLRARHIEQVVAGDTRVDLHVALAALSEQYGIRTVRVDSGGVLNGALLDAGLVEEVSLLLHPVVVAAGDARGLFRACTKPVNLRLLDSEPFGDLLWVRYTVLR